MPSNEVTLFENCCSFWSIAANTGWALPPSLRAAAAVTLIT